MAKTKRKWIQLDWSKVGCLRAQDIPYDSSTSIKTKIDSGTLKVSSTDTTLDTLQNKLSAGSNITITKLNTGSNEQLQISSSSTTPINIVQTSDVDFDTDLDGVDNGTALNMLSSLDFSSVTDGAIWFNSVFNIIFSYSNDLKLNFTYVANGDISEDKNVRLNFKIWILDDGDTPSEDSPNIDTNLDITITSTSTGKFYEKSNAITITNSNFNSNTKDIIFKVTRLATNSSDTYDGTFQITKFYLYQ